MYPYPVSFIPTVFFFATIVVFFLLFLKSFFVNTNDLFLTSDKM
uniref:Uncharacterized protein n=1 Tax=Anguilla anguilla TaxID=7936 RepID=A0A0E9R664_ANGAN